MRTLVIGAGGLIGSRLATLLAADGRTALRLADVSGLPAAPDGAECIEGDFCDPQLARRLLDGVDVVFHLAALLATEAEAEFDRGMAVNMHGLAQMLRLCGELPRPPRFIYASSIAAFGGPLPATVNDEVARTPRTSYGTQKAIAELLIDDYTRRGLVDGRVLRLPIVLVRNGPASSAVSDRVAALIREPLLGRDVACGLDPDAPMPITSDRRAAAAFLRLSQLDAGSFRHTRAMNMPTRSMTAAELADAVQRAPVRRKGRITWSPDPALQAVVQGWPQRFVSDHATALGLASEETAGDLVDAFIAEHGLQ